MLQALDHIALRSTDLERSIRFYQDLLGLHPGPRLSFAAPGCWLYAAGRAVVHLVEKPIQGHDGAVDHVAFVGRGRANCAAQLDAAGVSFELAALPDGSALQMFLRDPDGTRIELVFRDPEDR